MGIYNMSFFLPVEIREEISLPPLFLKTFTSENLSAQMLSPLLEVFISPFKN
jgi:hypothetical protein